ncbi:MAG: serine hydrolase domain-containing protein [Polyangiales bacterium]
MRRILLSAVFVLAACGNSSEGGGAPAVDAGGDVSDGPSTPLTLDAFMTEELELAKIPGMSVAIVKKGKVVFTGAWGYADLEAKTKVTPDTIFLVASVSKTVTAVAAMQLVEQGKLDLDADVNGYLPFTVRNWRFPDDKITMRMLLSHSASIQEDYIGLFTLIAPGDSKTELRAFVESFVVPGGSLYNRAQWGEAKPGTKYAYSQVGTSVAALVVEQLAGKPFDAYSKETIIEKLAMRDTSWRLAEVDVARVAYPYTYIASKGYVRNEHWGAPFFPAATIHTTAGELGKFLGSMSEHDGTLISAATETEMLRVQYPANDPDEGLLWQHRKIGGFDTVGHGGGAPGVSTTMYFRETDGVGVITLTNSDVHIRVSLTREEENDAYVEIEKRLFAEADKY